MPLLSLLSKENGLQKARTKALLQLLIDGNIAGKPLPLSAPYFESFCSCSSAQVPELQNPE